MMGRRPSGLAGRRRFAMPLFLALLAAACAPSPSLPPPSASPEPSPSASSLRSPSPSPSQAPAGWRALPASVAAPAAREDHTWTLDGAGTVAYLFGGRNDPSGQGAYGDLWAYDLPTGSWSQLAGGPPARWGHGAAWVPGTGLVIFAGQMAGGFFNDLWAYDPDGGAWRQLPASGSVPVARYGSCAALGPDGRLWMSHGFTAEGARFSDTRAYDFATGTWTDETPVGEVPVRRCLHGCWWTDAGRLTLFGGQTDGVPALGDRWELAVGPRPGTNAWAELGGTLPAPRNLYAAARWYAGTVVFGGQALDRTYLGDTWLLLDAGTALQALPEGTPGPAARSGAELLADPARGRLLLFGGTAGATTFGDLWELVLP